MLKIAIQIEIKIFEKLFLLFILLFSIKTTHNRQDDFKRQYFESDDLKMA